jgi:hypothetical protein
MRCWLSAWLLVLTSAAIHSTATAQTVDFNRDVRPIFSNRCLACHGPDNAKREAGLRLDDAAVATKALDSGHVAIVPNDPGASELLHRITSTDESVRMPPPHFGKPLTEREIAVLRRWISEGAHFSRHWSYVKPERPTLPEVDAEFAEWPENPIDNFALHKMIELGLKPSPEADSHALVRRVFLDLTGLPPTVEEAEEWVRQLDDSGNGGPSARHHSLRRVNDSAYQRLVDHLLQQPALGEHWGRKWLDLARYADSSGYADDPARTIWPWRDWVIRAINSNMPFDQFTIEQLAGDLLPEPTEDQIIATAFHRNTMTNNEGGTQDEEFRNVAVVDRVNTTMAVWMGTTIACAQCHSHKFDPLSQDEYFQIFAILNNTEDADRGDDSPRIQLFTKEQKQRRTEIQTRLAELDRLLATPTDAIVASQQQWEQRLRATPEWTARRPAGISRSSGGDSAVKEDGTILVSTPAAKDVYTVDIPLQPESKSSDSESEVISTIQIETIPSSSLPGGGSGHGDGNFVITELKAQLVPEGARGPEARFLRVEIPGKQQILSLAEVQVFASGSNVATVGKATQSSTDYAGLPELAIDGNTDGKYESKSVTHTAQSDDPWWELDMGKDIAIERIGIWNRTGDGVHTRLSNFKVSLLNKAREEIWSQKVTEPPNPSLELTPSTIREVSLIAAAADYQQDGFSPEEVLDGKTEPENGWAVGGSITESHHLIAIPEKPLAVTEPATLRLIIEQNSPYANHLLGQFRINTTSSTTAIEQARLPKNIRAIVQTASEQRPDADRSELANYYRLTTAPELNDARSERKSLQQEWDTMKPDTSAPILRELTGASRRKTFFQFRGNYLDKGHEVQEGVPAVFPPIPAGAPVNRLTFAKWLVSEENPLTARVVVNRYWETLFGRGIVATSEEFGSQGDLPTHPELLDWLACELKDSHWDTKALLRLIVTSATYRQTAKVTPEAAAADPENRWLARGPRVRLSAEMVRDQALQVSGLLSHKLYGPPVKPPQPSLGLSAAFGSSTDWQTSMGEDRYRRAIYTTWRRSNPYPSMATFDAPNREVCTLKRTRTNTPLQALVTLNDPVYVEAAQSLARLMLKHHGELSDQISYGFHRCLLRSPTSSELQSLLELYRETREDLSSDIDSATKLATDPLGPLTSELNPLDAAAMTIVGNVLLNLDEMVLKR